MLDCVLTAFAGGYGLLLPANHELWAFDFKWICKQIP